MGGCEDEYVLPAPEWSLLNPPPGGGSRPLGQAWVQSPTCTPPHAANALYSAQGILPGPRGLSEPAIAPMRGRVLTGHRATLRGPQPGCCPFLLMLGWRWSPSGAYPRPSLRPPLGSAGPCPSPGRGSLADVTLPQSLCALALTARHFISRPQQPVFSKSIPCCSALSAFFSV